ncbi:unnamed protein product [Vitrella brassicaformis CCMP3155]|uniref:Importin subunit alpha n=1 Tax=Vitrella brassicaformis (strain CCMP3155) TaxID=1169540 RepID=A0A0G4F9J6_VITBC|nr:unnamed protein product [Vitrella brassicaformis CCMP3155]|eukprot:CEM09037.1 unnamed protein product [Vitrella brassicaformis CCMP3155]
MSKGVSCDICAGQTAGRQRDHSAAKQRTAEHLKCDEMESADSTSGHPPPQAVLVKATKLYNAIHTQEAYDEAVQQRGFEAIEAEITAVMNDLCQVMASAGGPQHQDQPRLRADAVRLLFLLLSVKHVDVMEQKAISAGALPALVEQLSGCEEAQKFAAVALSELAVRHGDAVVVVDAGAVPPLVQLVSSPHDNVRVMAIAALFKTTEGSVACRNAVVAAGVLQPLLTAMRESTKADVLAMGAHLLGNLWCDRPLPAPLAEFAPFLPVLVNLIGAPQQNDRVLQPARRAVAHFASLCVGEDGTDADRDALVECGAVGSLTALLEVADDVGKCIACMMVHCIAEGTTAHVQTVIDADLVPLLVNAAARGGSDPRKREIAAASIGSIARGGSQQQVEYVVECGGVQPICDALDGNANDNRVITIQGSSSPAGRQKQALEGLPESPYSTLVEQAGGVDKLVELQTHNDIHIAAPAIVFLGRHIPDSIDEQRVAALYQQHVAQTAEVETNVGPDDDIGSGCDSDGGSEGEVDGQLEGDSGEEGAEG